MRNLRGTTFYMKTNVLEDFHICISVPLSANPIKWPSTLKQFTGSVVNELFEIVWPFCGVGS